MLPSWLKFWHKKPTQGVREARAARVQQERALASTVEKLGKEQRTVVQPLQRARERMRHENHVTEELIKLLRGNHS